MQIQVTDGYFVEKYLYLGGHQENIIFDMVDTSCNDGKGHTGENVGIITLAGIESLAVVGDWIER